MKLYQIKDDYITYLQNYEKKVLNNVDPKYSKARKYIWISLIEFNGIKYYLPLSSPKNSDYDKNTHNIKPSTLTIKRLVDKNGKLLGKIFLADMLPVPKEALVEYKLKDEQDAKYKILVQKEISLIKSIEHKLIKDSKVVYSTKTKNLKLYNWENACCDFKLLEQKCIEYQSSQNKDNQKESTETKSNVVSLDKKQPLDLKTYKQKANEYNDSISKHNGNNDLEL